MVITSVNIENRGGRTMDAGQQGMKINRVLRFISIVVMMVGFGVFTANAQTISGEIGGEETWSGVVFLSGDVTITETGNLTILPGTRIECEPKFDDQVGGQNSSRIEIPDSLHGCR